MQEEIDQLNELLSLCRNAEKGYSIAAQQLEDPKLKATLENYSRQRNEFAYELEQRIRIEGGDPEKRAGLAAGVHRIWINLKGIVSTEKSEAIIQECLRGETESIKFYEKILNETTFPNDTRMLLAHHLQRIKEVKRNLEEWT